MAIRGLHPPTATPHTPLDPHVMIDITLPYKMNAFPTAFTSAASLLSLLSDSQLAKLPPPPSEHQAGWALHTVIRAAKAGCGSPLAVLNAPGRVVAMRSIAATAKGGLTHQPPPQLWPGRATEGRGQGLQLTWACSCTLFAHWQRTAHRAFADLGAVVRGAPPHVQIRRDLRRYGRSKESY